MGDSQEQRRRGPMSGRKTKSDMSVRRSGGREALESYRRLDSDIHAVTTWTSSLIRVLLHPFLEQPTKGSPRVTARAWILPRIQPRPVSR